MRKFMITVQGVTYEVDVEEVAAGASAQNTPAVAVPAAAPVAAPVSAAPAKASAVKAPAATVAGGVQIKAPMPGTILAVNVEVGAAVKRGDVLCILEAMKMENEIMAPSDGKIAQVATSKGASVNPGDVLVVIA